MATAAIEQGVNDMPCQLPMLSLSRISMGGRLVPPSDGARALSGHRGETTIAVLPKYKSLTSAHFQHQWDPSTTLIR